MNPDERIGGIILEVKGDFCRKVKQILDRHGRGEDYIEISLDSEFRYNPLHNDLDAYALAFNIASLLNNLFGRGKEPFWQQAYTNLVKFIILLHKVAYNYVTLFNVYECAISPPLLEQRIRRPKRSSWAGITWRSPPTCFGEAGRGPAGLGFRHRRSEDCYVAEATPELRELLRTKGIPFEPRSILDPAYADPDKLAQLEAVKRWFTEDWKRIEPKLRTSIVEGISVFLSLFDDNPKVKRVFCPTKECYDPKRTSEIEARKTAAFVLLADRARQGLRAQFSHRHEPRARQSHRRNDETRFRAGRAESRARRSRRIPTNISARFSSFATNTSTSQLWAKAIQPGTKNFSASRDSQNAFPSSRRRASVRYVPRFLAIAGALCFRRSGQKSSSRLSDDFSAKTASELCGREDRLKVSYNLSESGHDARVSLLTGNALSHRANITASKSYNTQKDFRFDTKTFTELRNAQSVVIAYDGLNPIPPFFCYLKPYYNDPNKSYFQQLDEGEL